MKHIWKNTKLLFWLPRVLAILFIGFLAIFALDVFEPGKTFDYYIIALFMHLIPNFILTALLIIAWRQEKFGGILFILLSVLFTLFFRTYLFWQNFILISFPVFLIGGLFLRHDYLKRKGGELS